ncbi:MAG: type II secretion system F family protein [Nocardioidaceae bacterium]
MSPTVYLALGVGAIFSALLVGLAAAGVFSGQRGRMSRSMALLEAFSTAPKSMQQELEPGFQDRVLNPLLQKLTGLGRKLTPEDNTARLRQKLDAAGNPPGWTTDRVVALKTAGFGGGLLLGIFACLVLGLGLMPTLIVTIGLSLAGYMAPNLWLYQRAFDRSELAQKTLPDALDLLTISVEAGLGFDAALAHVAKHTEGPLAEEFARLLQEMQLGAGRTESLRAMGERTTLAELKAFVTAMVQADAFGIPIGRVLRVQSTEMRTKRRQRAEEKAQKVPVKILFPLIFCILPCLFLMVMGPGVITMLKAFTGIA